MSADFEPPKYVQSLIASINDAAKAAQTSALFLLALGLYLVATVISTTDEDLLRGTAVQLSQLGVRTPVAIVYALAPTIFLFLHVHTLIRFDMLAANLRLLAAELARAVPLASDGERCRALLANVEFVQVLAAPPGSSFRSPLFRFMAWLIISALPVGVFLAVQISFLRYQSEAITTLHQVCLALDLAALSWFHMRLWLAGRKRRLTPASAFHRRMALHAGLPLLVIAFAVVYAGVPSAERTTVRSGVAVLSEVLDKYERRAAAAATWAAFKGAASQPLDLAACPWLAFGCRFLRLDHRTLLAATPPAEVLVRLRIGKSDDLGKDLAQVEGLFLRGRTLRFADFTESRLYAADLMEADLRGARLESAQLQGATLLWTRLQGAELARAQLQCGKLAWAKLQGANLSGAQLQGGKLAWAKLQGANLSGAQLQGAFLWGAELVGTLLPGAQMQLATLAWTHLQGADLRYAELRGANLDNAKLQGADLREIRLWQTSVNSESNLGLADLRSASWQPLRDDETAGLSEMIGASQAGDCWEKHVKLTLDLKIAVGAWSDHPPEFALDNILLVDNVEDPRWQRLDRARLTTDEAAYDEALVPFLADLARRDPHVARGLASRVEGEEPGRAARLGRGLLDRAGLALPEDVRQRLSKIALQPEMKD